MKYLSEFTNRKVNKNKCYHTASDVGMIPRK